MTDEEIIGLFWRRDESGIRQAERKYGSYCSSLVRRILPEEDAEECMNDLWLRVWDSIPPQRPRELKLYLARIARNLAVNVLRDRRAEKRGSGETEALLNELAECLPGGDTPEESYQAKELEAAVNRFLRRLPRREGDAFIRRYFFAETPQEIGERYGMRENTVNVMLCRTRKKLRAYLKQEGYL